MNSLNSVSSVHFVIFYLPASDLKPKYYNTQYLKAFEKTRLLNVRLHNLLLSAEVDGMDGTCSTHGGDDKYIQNFGRKT
jgi:hypothetical protein